MDFGAGDLGYFHAGECVRRVVMWWRPPRLALVTTRHSMAYDSLIVPPTCLVVVSGPNYRYMTFNVPAADSSRPKFASLRRSKLYPLGSGHTSTTTCADRASCVDHFHLLFTSTTEPESMYAVYSSSVWSLYSLPIASVPCLACRLPQIAVQPWLRQPAFLLAPLVPISPCATVWSDL